MGHIFSVSGPDTVLDGVPANYRTFSTFDLKETTNVFAINAFLGSTPIVRLQFKQLGGIPLIAKTTVDFPSPTWDLALAFDTVENRPVCVVKTPDINIVQTAPLWGMTNFNMSVKLEYVTGKPVRLTVYRADGTIFTSGPLINEKCKSF